MSLITQCPACSTMFRVVPDQLRVSEGWVRCGNCDEVFDANVHLQPSGAALAPQVTPKEPPPAPAPAIDDTTAPAAAQQPAEEAAPPPQSPVEPVMDPLLAERPAEEKAIEPLPAPFAHNISALGDVLEPTPPQPESPRYVQADAPVAAASPHASVEHLSFMRKRRKRSFWERRTGRALLLGVSVLSAGLLMLQVAMFERERLAASEPALRPALLALCELAGCKISGLRQLDVLQIDSSGFAKVRGDVYRLSFNLHNAGPLPVAMPALELTLTDAQDQPLLRRVLQSTDFAPAQSILAAGAEFGATLPVSVNTEQAGVARFSGYRLLAFYP